jgi:hypothetical protein
MQDFLDCPDQWPSAMLSSVGMHASQTVTEAEMSCCREIKGMEVPALPEWFSKLGNLASL